MYNSLADAALGIFTLMVIALVNAAIGMLAWQIAGPAFADVLPTRLINISFFEFYGLAVIVQFFRR